MVKPAATIAFAKSTTDVGLSESTRSCSIASNFCNQVSFVFAGGSGGESGCSSVADGVGRGERGGDGDSDDEDSDEDEDEDEDEEEDSDEDEEESTSTGAIFFSSPGLSPLSTGFCSPKAVPAAAAAAAAAAGTGAAPPDPDPDESPGVSDGGNCDRELSITNAGAETEGCCTSVTGCEASFAAAMAF